MGYSTDFYGTLEVSPPLNEYERDYLEDFATTEHTSTAHGLLDVSFDRNTVGVDPQAGKPGISCDWVSDDEGNLIWAVQEKTYFHDQWLVWLIRNLFGPDSRDFVQQRLDEDPRLQHFTHDHVINGVVEAYGERRDDTWRILVIENTVTTHAAGGPSPEQRSSETKGVSPSSSDMEEIVKEAAENLVAAHTIERADGESALQALAWDLGEGTFTYEAGISALVAEAVQIDRAQCGRTPSGSCCDQHQ